MIIYFLICAFLIYVLGWKRGRSDAEEEWRKNAR